MSLQKRILTVTSSATQGGALKLTGTRAVEITDKGITFIVRVVENLIAKEKATAKQQRNPFLPHEEALYLGECGKRHKLLLNKFPVQLGHFLICTKDFEKQSEPLNQDDFYSIALVLWQLQGSPHLVFYNFGRHSGRSQPHKHIQAVPLPLSEESRVTNYTPIDRLIDKYPDTGLVFQIEAFHFQHRVVKLPAQAFSKEPTNEVGYSLLEIFRNVLEDMDIRYCTCEDIPELSYNVLLTEKWLMVVPRTSEEYQGFKINAVGFAGSILVKNEAHLKSAQAIGPLKILENVASAL